MKDLLLAYGITPVGKSIHDLTRTEHILILLLYAQLKYKQYANSSDIYRLMEPVRVKGSLTYYIHLLHKKEYTIKHSVNKYTLTEKGKAAVHQINENLQEYKRHLDKTYPKQPQTDKK